MASRMDRLTLDDCVPADLAAQLADRLAEALANGDSVLLTGPANPFPLFAAAARHSSLVRATVFHVGPPLDLISMLRQVTADDGPKDATLEQGFNSLTTPGAGCERIVLFVAEAHLLPHATLRYIEFALHAGPHLTVALAGQNGLSDLLALDGFAGLRNRIPVHFLLPDAGPARTDHPPVAPMSSVSNLALAYRMTPPRLLACAAAAAGLAVVGMMSLSPSAGPVTAVLAVPETATSVAAVEPSPEPASAQPVPTPVGVASSAEALDASVAAAQQAPGAAPFPSPATEVASTFAAGTPAAAGIVAVNAPDVPSASVPVSTPEAADPSPGAPSRADAAGTADAPAQPETAQAGIPGILPGSTPEPGAEVAEATAAPDLHPAMPSEPPAAAPSQVDGPAPGMVAALTAEPVARPDNTAAVLPPAAQLTVPMPAARQAHAAVLPVLPHAPYRSTVIRPERVAERLPAPSGDGQRCRNINLRL